MFGLNPSPKTAFAGTHMSTHDADLYMLGLKCQLAAQIRCGGVVIGIYDGISNQLRVMGSGFRVDECNGIRVWGSGLKCNWFRV